MSRRYVEDDEREILARQIGNAYDTLRRTPDRERALLRTQLSHIPMLYEPEKMDPGAWRGLKMRLPPPSGRDLSLMDEALGWMSWLGHNYPDFAKAIYLVDARRMPVTVCARILHCSRGTVYNRRRGGLDLIANRYPAAAVAA